MRIRTFAVPVALGACAFIAASAHAQAAPSPQSAPSGPAVVTIDSGHLLHSVSPTLYGLMTEEINHSYEGGLYAEMVSNNTFQADWSGVNDWFVVEDGNAEAKIGVDRTTGPSSALPASLRIDVASASPAAPAGVLNVGYWGMAVQPNTVYRGTFYAREDSTATGPVTISLVANQSGNVLASAVVPGIGTEWRQYKYSFTSGNVQPSAANHLVLTVAHPGTLWLDGVTLFPPTYADTPNGNRIDLMKLLAAMRPSFLRFPGGNYLEGDTIAERFDWKKTIGPLVDRPGHASPWGYWSTDGMGLLEFLEWCEDLHMQPMLAVYAGYSLHGEHVDPGPALQPYVQSALEEIQYVSGGSDTHWGAIRAKDGHPKPFDLRYVEIGNEDFFDKSGSYDGRFAQFYKAIKAQYPQLQLIATAPVTGIRPDVLDEHYYLRATQFFNDAHHYDNTSRNGPKIFVGEWATREGSPTPNLGAALGDAAWMTGLERNSDIVIMASYAPLFTNVNPGASQWAPDLIGYDALRSYGSPSYYAQAIFAGHLGTETPESSVTNAGPRFFCSVTENPQRKELDLKLVNATSQPQDVEVRFLGARPRDTAEMIRLRASGTQATNSIRDPRAIVPVESRIPGLRPDWHHTMPPYSIEVVVVKLR